MAERSEGMDVPLERLVRPRCAATITAPSSEGYERVCMRRQLRATRRKRRRCERPACENGYCWQHQRLAAEMELIYQRNPALRPNKDYADRERSAPKAETSD